MRGSRRRLGGAWWTFVLLWVVLVLPHHPLHGQTAQLHVPGDSVSIGERFSVALIVERPATASVRVPEPALGDTTLGDLEILGIERASRELPGASGFVRDSIRYLVTTFALDTAFVPPLEIGLHAGSDTLTLRTASSIIPVRSIVPADAEDIQDIAPIVDFPRALWPWILLGAILLLAAGLVYLWYRRRKRRPVQASPPAPPVPPYEEALARLKRLDESDLNDVAEIKPFYVELSDLLRTYIERRTGIPALESTSRELIRYLERAQAAGFPSTVVADLRVVLDRADLVKFADARPAADESRRSAEQVRSILERVEEAQRSAAQEVEAHPTNAVEA